MTFTAYPRDLNRSFPPATRRTLEEAVRAGLAAKQPFDVHLPSGAVAWTWEQRS